MALIKLNRTKTGAVPKTLADGELYIDQLNGKLYWADATGVIRSTYLQSFVPGTRMLFQQSTAPVGWTKDATLNDRALRVVSGTVGTGGSVAFSAAFGAAGVTGGTALSVAQMPSHSHGVNDPGHAHNSQYDARTNGHAPDNIGERDIYAQGYAWGFPVTASATGIWLSATGGNQAHTHPMPNLNYVDVIVATKDA
jgi:microcystin-dependent protein